MEILKKIVFISFLLTLSSQVYSQSELSDIKNKKTIVAIINLDCPFCKASFKNYEYAQQQFSNSNVNFVVAPIPSNLKNILRELIYYITKEKKSKKQAMLVLDAFYRMNKDYKFEKLDEYIAYLISKYPNYEWKFIFNEYENLYYGKTDIGMKQLEKALSLMKLAGVTSYPAYVRIENGGATRIIPSEKLDGTKEEITVKALNYLKETIKRETK